MLKINLTALPQVLTNLSKQAEVYAPLKKAGAVNFERWDEEKSLGQLELRRVLTAKSAKSVFFPQVENLMDFTTQGKQLELKAEPLPEQDTVIFGVRGCDVASFAILDKVFLQAPVDEFYQARREHCTIITLACNEPEETCFCTVYGINPAQPQGDVLTYLVGKELYWQAQTNKGEQLLAQIESLLQPAEETEVEATKTQITAILEHLPLKNLHPEAAYARSTEELFADPVWAKLSTSCLGCGTCTFVCPTCHCYDVRDYEVKGKVRRFRCWDSCMFSDFTRMSAGNPRRTRLERFRQRFLHKLKYYPENNNGVFACVGCGRCLQKCPSHLHIAQVIKALEVTKHV